MSVRTSVRPAVPLAPARPRRLVGPPGDLLAAGRAWPLLVGRIALCAVLGLAVTACGSGDDGGKVATAGSTKPSASGSGTAQPEEVDEQDAMLKYSQCMRENGVPDFPDPVVQGGGGTSLSIPDGIDVSRLPEAEGKCKQFMPGGENKPVDPEIATRNRELAKCMRDNGVPNFPDPAADGTLQIQATPGSGLEPGNAAFEAASKKCNMQPPGGGLTSEDKR